ncbi:MAG: TetR/AcrR family transcriptional regulator [Pseudomonadota bacterium]
MGRRNLHSREQQQEMAIAAAELLLIRDGLAGLTMRKVAEVMGYTVGNLYLLFANQDVLLLAVNERTGDAIHAALRAAADAEPDAKRRPHAIAAAYIDFGRRHTHRWRLMFEHSLPPETRRPPEADARIRRMFELVQSVLTPLLPKLDNPALHLAATVLWSSVHGLCALAATGKLRWSGSDDHRAVSDALVDCCLAGLKSQASSGLIGKSGVH